MTDEGVVTKVSPFGVADTVARMSKVISDRGLTLFGVIDHSGEAHAVGLEMRDAKLVMFGNPKARRGGLIDPEFPGTSFSVLAAPP
jgi:uncharacterized protein (DUF302 family)